jgi:hypothetical protein
MLRANVGNLQIQRRTSKIDKDSTPTAATLFHELFHLVMGNEATTLDHHTASEVYDWTTMMTLRPSDLLKNPETYTLAAVAYDITSNDTPVNGHRVEFYLNYAIRG